VIVIRDCDFDFVGGGGTSPWKQPSQHKLILDDRFTVAVKSTAHELGDVPLAGFETYGEIALDAGDMSGFHNTTTVVLALPRGVP
jgi:hypothetical protein